MPLDHPFRTLANLLATPHIGYVSRGLYARFFRTRSRTSAVGSTARQGLKRPAALTTERRRSDYYGQVAGKRGRGHRRHHGNRFWPRPSASSTKALMELWSGGSISPDVSRQLSQQKRQSAAKALTSPVGGFRARLVSGGGARPLWPSGNAARGSRSVRPSRKVSVAE